MLSDEERERYGRVARQAVEAYVQQTWDAAEYSMTVVPTWDSAPDGTRATYIAEAAGVIAAYQADLAATVRQWRDEAEQRRTFYRDHAEDGDFRDFLIREQALYDAFASVLQLLEGGR